MEPADVAALSRSITVMSPQHLARHTVEEAIESAERAAARSRISYAAAPVVEKHQLDSQYESQMELEAHYIEVRRLHLTNRCYLADSFWVRPKAHVFTHLVFECIQ